MAKDLSVLEKSLLQNINKKDYAKDNPMVQLTEETEYGKPRGWVDTGIYALNWVISGDFKGGYPVGRITEMAGDPGTGKSLLCEIAMKDPGLDLIIYFDTEAAMNIEFVKFLGVDPSKILYQSIDTVEDLQDVCEEVLNTIINNKQGSKKILMVIDSIALASTRKEMDPEGGSDMGYKAREIRSFFRKYARKIEKYNIALLITNHYTQKIGQVYGPSKVTTGGTGLVYAASVRLDLKVEELELDKKLEAIGASAVTLQATTMKNRCFSPRRKINFVLDFEKGVNAYSGLIKILLDYNLVQKSGGWYVFPAWTSEKKFYSKDFPKIVEENNLLPLIQKGLEEAISREDPVQDAQIEAEAMEEVAQKEADALDSGKKKRSRE
jgi:recombination protein RecA